jgi:small-conductance mechanosensitive channel
MDFTEFFDRILFSLGGIEFNLVRLIGFLVTLTILLGLERLAKSLVRHYFKNGTLEPGVKSKIKWLSWISLVLVGILVELYIFEADTIFLHLTQALPLKLSTVISGMLLLLLAHLADVFITNVLAQGFTKKQKVLKGEGITQQSSLVNTNRLVRPPVYVFVLLLILYNIDVLNYTFYSFEKDGDTITFRLSNILVAILIFQIARLIIWVTTEIVMVNYYRKKTIDIGSRYAVNQLLKYFIVTIAIFSMIESLGINLTLIWGGAAALLVGIGLGLQQTFNDLTCGFILLFERTVEVDDVVQMGEMVGVVKKIGVRTSLVETRDDITVIVPNSKLVGENVINWSHYRTRSRFHLSVGVAYGSDVELVKKVLLQSVEGHDKIMSRPAPFVRFTGFGESSLDFELHFWSKDLMRIENVKSDLRFKVYQLFTENNITIPFPQRDVNMKN